MKSGICYQDKDLITECSAQEFRDFTKEKGMDLTFMSDRTLNGEKLEGLDELFRWEIRSAFIMDLEARGVKIDKNVAENQTFAAKLHASLRKRWE